MPTSRYRSDSIIGRGKILSTAQAVSRIRFAIRRGTLMTKSITLKSNGRLDKIAGSMYGDGRLWWVIAAASNIGWGLQVPAGTNLKIPLDLGDVLRLV